jgi:acyl-CoA reductase-like NAD-dependent aldehyde dehydrogenase
VTATISSGADADADSDAAAARTYELTHPATGAVVGRYPVHTAADVEAAVARSRQAATWWADLGYAERRRRLNRWTAWLGKHSDEICELGFAEAGKPKGDVLFELMAGLEDIKWAAGNAGRVLGRRKVNPGLAMMNFEATVEYFPLGVVGVITPWNFPTYTPLCGMAYALAAGNGVVVKPSEYSTATGAYIVESFRKANPDTPEGLVAWVSGFGETGAALCRSGVGKIAFTGSVPTGRRVMATCAETLTPVLLELGGKDATVVAADADLDAAADSVIWGGFWHAGQACVGVERVYVVESVRDEFLRRIKERAEKITVGLDEVSDYGPMTLPAQIDIVRRHVTDALERGATALVGGLDSIKPPYIEPIVLVDVPEDSSAVQEETFGPVVVVNTVPDSDEAVRRANGTSFGLASSVFSAHHGPEIAAKLTAGGTTINSVMTFVGIPSLPFGGIGDSGFGRFHGEEGLREFARPKSTTRKKFSPGREMQVFPRTKDQYKVTRRFLRLRFARRVR